jgi:hypothetical protein
MKLSPPGARLVLALAAASLAPGASACAARRVSPPPAPPAFQPAAERPRVDAPSVGANAEPQRASPPAAPAVAEPATRAEPAPAAPSAREDPPLGWIAGQPLEAEELLLEWGDVASRELFLVLDKLVAARLALAEAARLAIKLSPEAVEQRYQAEREKLAREVPKSARARSLEEFIEQELGFEPKQYLERVRRATIRQMLAERAVRASSLASESVALRLIVAESGEAEQKVAAALAAGRPFAEVALELSLDDSREKGGLVPFVVQEERSPLARLAFQTPVGEVAGPLPIAEHKFWIKVEERRAPLEGDWAVVEAAVEASLSRHPVEDAEFVHWKIVMEGRYPIDLGPLWSLIGAAR